MEKKYWTPQERAAYYRSMTWKYLCQKVRHRCNGICERCKKNPMVDTHHLTYEHFGGDELLSELQGVCRACHRFLHKKSTYDPAATMADIDKWVEKVCKEWEGG